MKIVEIILYFIFQNIDLLKWQNVSSINLTSASYSFSSKLSFSLTKAASSYLKFLL